MLKSALKIFALFLLAAQLRAEDPPAMPDALAVTIPSRAEMEQAANMKFIDWLQPGAPGYSELRQGAASAQSTNWIAPRLADGKPVPQASARELAMELIENDRVAESVKEDLKKAFPSETKQFVDHRPQNEAELLKLSPKIEEMEKRLDYIEATMKKNVYDKGTFPSASFNLAADYHESNGEGLNFSHDASHSVKIAATVSGQLPDGSFSFGLESHYDRFNDGNIIGKPRVGGASLTLGTFQVSFGISAPYNFATLIYSGISVPNSNLYYGGPADVWSGIGLNPAGVGPSSQYFELHRISQATWWWPFYDSHYIFSPAPAFFYTWVEKIYTHALRLDLSPLQGWIFSDVKPYFALLNSYVDEAQKRSFSGLPNSTQTQMNRAYALGMDMSLENGSTLLAEGGISEWSRNDLVDSFADSAVFGLFTLPVGDLTLVFDAAQIGPNYITGGNGPRRSGNGQTGAIIDTVIDDYERKGLGKPAQFSHQTIMREPEALTNNSRRFSVKAEAQSSWLSAGLVYVYSEQIVASGPWIQSHFVENGLGYNGAGWFYRMGFTYNPIGYGGSVGGGTVNALKFAQATEANAYYQGTQVKVGDGLTPNKTYWQEVDQMTFNETQTFLLLSQNGVGDNRTRPDSIKYLGDLKGKIKLDLKPLFDRDYPSDVLLTSDLRDLTENPQFPTYTDEHLLTQLASDISLRWGITRDIDFLATAAYETWLSQAGLYPLNYIMRAYGAGLDFKLDVILSGMNLAFRINRFEFDDINFGLRSHSNWDWRIGTGINY